MRIRGLHIASAVLVTALSATPVAAGPITTDPASAAQMVAELLAADPGMIVLGASVLYTGSPDASGTFAGGGGILPFDSGVALTSGRRNLIPGPNSDPFTGVNNGLPGDPDLTAIAGDPTYDVSKLVFSFIPEGNAIRFEYVFGSDEYDEFVGAPFNDTFAFLLNGVNIALIPGTAIPVSINTVNEGQNAEYFTNNNGSGLDIEYDGLVGANDAYRLVATGAVTPGVVNTISLIIGDVSDGFIDSGVLLRGGSFTSIGRPTPPGAPEPGALALLALGGALRVLRRRA